MIMSPGVRKVVLAGHIALSVGWVGAVAAYVAALTSQNAQTLRVAYVGMDLIARNVIVPLALVALLTGLVVSLGTKWGLIRYWWVLISFLLTVFATVVLLSETRTISHYATVAADPATSIGDLRALGSTLPHSVGGMLVLLVVLFLNVLKPQGLTAYGWRKKRQERARLVRRTLTASSAESD